MFGEVDLVQGFRIEIGEGEIEAIAGRGEGADWLEGGGVGLLLLFDCGEIAGGDLETAEQHQPEAGFELADSDGVDDLRDGHLDGVAVFEGGEMDMIAGSHGFGRTIGAVTELEAMVGIAEGSILESDSAAFVAGGLDVAAERCGHEDLLYP